MLIIALFWFIFLFDFSFFIIYLLFFFFFFQAEDGIRDTSVTGVQTCALPISVGAREDGLSFFRQQPIDINLARVGMGRLVEKRKRSIRRTHVGTFFELPGVDDRDGDTLFGARDRDKICRADEHRITALSDRVDLLRVVLKNSYLLLTQRADEIHAELRVKIKKSKCRLSRPRSARIVHDQFALPFWIEQILVGLELP